MKSTEAVVGILVKIDNEYATIDTIRDYGIIVKYLISKHKSIAKFQYVQIVNAEELFELGWEVEQVCSLE